MIAKWFAEEAERARTTLVEICVFGNTLIFGGNGTLFRPTDIPGACERSYEWLCIWQGFADPTDVFYRDPYGDEEERTPWTTQR